MAGQRQEKNAGKAKNFDMNALSTCRGTAPSTPSIPCRQASNSVFLAADNDHNALLIKHLRGTRTALV
jgi:hypothetical protein